MPLQFFIVHSTFNLVRIVVTKKVTVVAFKSNAVGQSKNIYVKFSKLGVNRFWIRCAAICNKLTKKPLDVYFCGVFLVAVASSNVFSSAQTSFCVIYARETLLLSGKYWYFRLKFTLRFAIHYCCLMISFSLILVFAFAVALTGERPL